VPQDTPEPARNESAEDLIKRLFDSRPIGGRCQQRTGSQKWGKEWAWREALHKSISSFFHWEKEARRIREK
jgi:hypothetical protein